MVSNVVSHFGGCGFPLEEQSMRLTIINALIEPPLPICMIALCSEKGEGQVQGFLRSLGLSSSRVPGWELTVSKFQDPRGVDSPAGV